MKNLTKFLGLAVLGMALTSNVFGQATATATATATIITPISISKTADMSFGNVAVSATVSGTVVLAPAGGRTATGGCTLPSTTGTVTAASFTVNGQGTSTYAITLPAGPYTISSAGNNMTLTSFTSTPSATGALTAGTQTLNVGATLNVTNAQAPGTYTNATPFDVTVNYN